MPRSKSRGRRERPPAAATSLDLDGGTDDDDVVVAGTAAAAARPAAPPQDVIDVDLDGDDEDDSAAALEGEILKAKRELQQEIKREKVEIFDRPRAKEKKTKSSSKIKKETKDDEAVTASKEKSRKEAEPKEGRKRKRARSGSKKREKKERKRRRAQQSSSSSASSTSSEPDNREPYEIFKPYTKVTLVNLVRKADLNGKTGQVVHPSVAVCPCPPGCVLVRLETGREIAIKPPNLMAVQAFHHGPQQASLNQEMRLQQVLRSIRLNVDSVSERTEGLREGGGSALIISGDGKGTQGGIGHVV